MGRKGDARTQRRSRPMPSPFCDPATLGYQITALGTRLSPLHNRFRAKSADRIAEAATLTSLKAELH